MSREIDERVVSLEFDNRRFETNAKTSLNTLEKLKQSLNFTGASKGLENVSAAAKSCNLSPLSSAAETVKMKFSAMEVVAVTALANITNSAVNSGKRLARAFTIEPIGTGLKEYETQINAVQTILANTESKGTTLDDVNQALDTLNTYADKTIYNFTEMTRNIGTFTAAGIDLDTSVNAIQGIANLAAVSGSNAQQASTAMYQLSQALASGTVKLMDWNSVVNAGMGGQVFQDALKETARVHGVAIDDMIKKNGSFRETLQEGWLTSDILTETLQKFTLGTENLTEAQIEANRQMLKAKGYSDKQIESIFKLGDTATNAATKVKTFTQLMDTLKEAAQSGWTQTWELIIGDFDEAKTLWTGVSEVFSKIIGESAESRNKLLEGALTSKWDKLVKQLDAAGISADEFNEKTTAFLEKNGFDMDRIIEKYGSLEEAFRSGAIHSNWLKKAVDNLNTSVSKFDGESINRELKKGMRGDDVKKVQQALSDLNYDFSKFGVDGIIGSETEAAIKAFQEFAGIKVTGIIDDETIAALEKATTKASDLKLEVDDLISGVTELGGRELLIQSFKNAWEALTKPLKAVKDAFRSVFKPMKPETLYNVIVGIESFTSKLIMSNENANKIRRTFKGLFSILEIITTILGGGVKFAFKALSMILEHFDLNILDVTASVGDALVKFRNWLFENNRLVKGFGKVIDVLVKFAVKVKDWIKAFVELPEVQEKIKNIKDGFINAFTEPIDKIKKFFNLIKNFGKTIEIDKGLFKKVSFEDIASFFKTELLGSFKNAFSNVGTVFENIKNTFVELFKNLFAKVGIAKEGIGGFLSSIGDKLVSFKDKVVSAFTVIKSKIGDKMGVILAIGSLLSFVFILNKMKKLLAVIANPFEAFGGIADGIKNFIGSFEQINNAKAGKIKTEAIKNIATSVAILAGAVWVIAQIPKEDIWRAVGVMGILAGGILAMVAIVKVIDLIPTKSDTDIAAFGKMLAKIGIALLLMTVSLKILGNMDPEAIKQGGIAIGIFLGIVTVMMAMSKLIGTGNIAQFGTMLKRLSTALLLMTASIYILGKMDPTVLTQGMTAVAKFMLMVGILMAISKLIGKGDISKFGGMMVKLGVALLLISASIKILGGMDYTVVEQGMKVILTFVGIIGALMIIAKMLGKNEAAKFGSMMFGIGTSLAMMAISIKILGSMKASTLKKGTKAVAGLLGMIAVMMLATKLLGKNTADVAKFGVMILAFSASMLVLTASIAILGTMDESNIDKAISALTKISLLFSVIMVASKFAGAGITGTIVALGIAIAAIAGSIGALAFISDSNPEGVKTATAALAALMGMFAVLVASSKFAGTKVLGTILSMTVAIGALAGIVYLLSDLPVEQTLGTATALSELILALSIACLVMSKIPVTGAFMGGLAFGAFMLTLGGVLAIIGFVNEMFPDIKKFIDESAPLLESVGSAIGKLIGGLVGGFAAAASNGLSELADDFSDFVEGLSSAFDTLSGVDDTVVDKVGTLTTAVLKLAAAEFITALTTLLGVSEEDAGTFGDRLKGFGEGISEFSKAVSGDNAIDSAAVENAITAAASIIDVANDIPNSGGWLGKIMGENDVDTFGTKLKAFGEGIAEFSKAVSGDGTINKTAMINAVEGIAGVVEIANGIPNSGGWIGKIMGENDIDTFGTKLKAFGEGVAEFSKAVSGEGVINKEAMINATEGIAGVIEAANAIPNSGGWIAKIIGDNDIETFAGKLGAVGAGIVAFSKAVSGEGAIDSESTKVAAEAVKNLAIAASNLPTEGGLNKLFVGITDIDGFVDNLSKFGSGIKEFSANSAEIDPETTLAASEAAKNIAHAAMFIEQAQVYGANTETYSQFITAFGTALKDFSDRMSKIENLDSITIASSLASAISSLIKTTSGKDTTSVTEVFDNLGASMVDFADDITGIDVQTVTDAIDAIADIDVSGLEAFSKSLTDIGKEGIDKFISAFENSSDKVYKVGELMISQFVKGVNTNKAKISKSFTAALSDAISEIRKKRSSFYNAGNYLVEGFADGIDENTFKATAEAVAMAKAALEAAEEALGIKSPSRAAYADGAFFVEGFVNAITDNVSSVYKAGRNMASSARDGLATTIAKISELIENDVDTQPTIRPVVDLSDVTASAGAINGMFDTNPSLSAAANLRSIGTMMNHRQNGANNDVISAIKDLGNKISNMSGDTYQFGNISYDSSSEVGSAVHALARAIKMEGRK